VGQGSTGAWNEKTTAQRPERVERKNLVGNKGYRRYLKVQGDNQFVIDEKQIKAEACYDGCCAGNTFYNAETVAHFYPLSSA
jgi:hypothetical protein